MPAGEERDAFLRGERLEVLDLADRRAGRLLQEDVLAGFESRAGRLMPHLRRLAKRHGVDLDTGSQHFLDGGKIGDAVDRRVAAGGCDEAVVAVLGEGGQMLVADDLADADDALA